MAIKVNFAIGDSLSTVKGLYQWDYGQVLELECSEIGNEILEVHFACTNMSEAIVRACTFSEGIGNVAIPDECLEQAGAITIWICRVDSTQRRTVKTISLPLTARTRPSNSRDIPAAFIDQYGQLIEEVNEAINALEKGDVIVAKALSADTAKSATTAGSATDATHATKADSATSAGSADTAKSINKYLHNVRISFKDVSLSVYTNRYIYGDILLLIVTDSADSVTNDNIIEKMAGVTPFVSGSVVFCLTGSTPSPVPNPALSVTVGKSGVSVVYFKIDGNPPHEKEDTFSNYTVTDIGHTLL